MLQNFNTLFEEKEYLRKEYQQNFKSANRIASELGYSTPTILKRLKEHGFAIRGRKKSLQVLSRIPPKTELIRLRRNGFGPTAISKMYNVSLVTVRNWNAYYGITHIRHLKWKNMVDLEQHPVPVLYEEPSKTTFSISDIEKKFGMPINNLLWKLYHREGRSARSIAIELGTTSTTILSYIDTIGIPHRGKVESLKLKYKTNNPEKDVKQLAVEYPEVRAILSLGTVSNDFGKMAEILYSMFPGRFQEAAQLAMSLPGAVKSIGYSLQPFTLEKSRGIYEKIHASSPESLHDLEELLFNIACDHYQIPFSKNPKKVIKEIENYTVDSVLQNLAIRILDHYLEVFTFTIPGYGSLEDRVK